ncbi:MAG: ATP-dependent sacrificial sulfur transferase LarE [Methylacidiphilales bacterium]|nr:ATP-dependent sacrificial sulfur transferase LarE [Candidatus Methylacidiphilales bacterium]
MSNLSAKQDRLDRRLRELGRLLVAYSGGVDSAYLAWSAHQMLGPEMVAVLADSPSLSRNHFADALAFAKQHRIPLHVLETNELERADYVKNNAQRCFYCKDELFSRMEEERNRLGFRHLAYGMNLDDRGDFRPGQAAARGHGVLAPLVEAELTKQDVRALARAANLRVWDKPASACLSSRLAYGQPVTRAALGRVEQGEERLRALGFVQFRVRDHGDLARIEIAPEEMPAALAPGMLSTLSATLKELGFHYVTLDCEGYRSGSMNAVLNGSLHPHAHRLS